MLLLSIWALQVAFLVRDPFVGQLRHSVEVPPTSVAIEPYGPLFHPFYETEDITLDQHDGGSQKPIRLPPPKDGDAGRRVLVIAAAPRSVEHVVALWTSLECFTADADHVAVSAPTWSQLILEEVLSEAVRRIPRFASGEVTLEGMVGVNDRYDVGLWCDALAGMGLERHPKSSSDSPDGDNYGEAGSPYDEIALLNDSVYALREYSEIFRALGDENASMTSLNYSFFHPKGTGEEWHWLESVWRGFDRTGIRTFVDHSCRPATDPYFCPRAWWGRKGCIVENFERAMAWQFPRDKTFGLFPSDVPADMLTLSERFHNYRTWVRHPAYWNKLVEEDNFPVSKLNWEGMVDSIDDERLRTCTRHLDRSWLEEGFDFSVVQSAL